MLDLFDADAGVAPTSALVTQLTRRLRRDFDPIKIGVHQLTAAADIDALEDLLVQATERKFHVLVATPAKLSLVVRNNRVARSLTLVVMDEAHNPDSGGRELRLEVLLALSEDSVIAVHFDSNH